MDMEVAAEVVVVVVMDMEVVEVVVVMVAEEVVHKGLRRGMTRILLMSPAREALGLFLQSCPL
ncbi:hypothetical protein HanPI659440_Chr12g0468751 [Helianthus annuus]|nr:hypothetical protein HanPI659440_Chr12g0468751 [Helianthus annuus]